MRNIKTTPHKHSNKIVTPSLSVIAALVAVVATTGAGAQTLAQTTERVDSILREMAARGESLPVSITLNKQPHKQILEQVRSATRQQVQDAEDEYRRLASSPLTPRDQVRAARQRRDAAVVDSTTEAARQIEAEIGPQQDKFEARLLGLGAKNIVRIRALNMLAAVIPASALTPLEGEPEIIRIAFSAPDSLHAGSAAEVNLNQMNVFDFWQGGLYTGEGESVAVIDSGIDKTHVHFLSRNIDDSRVHLSNPAVCAPNDTGATDAYGHGTSVSSIITGTGIAAGLTGLSAPLNGALVEAVARDLGKFNLGTLYSLKAYCVDAAGTAQFTDGDVIDALSSAVIGRAATATHPIKLDPLPVGLFNYSAGHTALTDDDNEAQVFDNLIDTYGIGIAIAAGNNFNVPSSVNSPCLAYNDICVANINPATNLIAGTSSFGPTIGDGHNNTRKKPDIAAPGQNIVTAKANSSPNYTLSSGTSAAAPHIAGALALLAQSGVTTNVAAKALLINSANQAKNAAATQFVGWLANVGWGYADLKALHDAVTIAKQQPSDPPCVVRSQASPPPPSGCFLDSFGVTGNTYRFYRGTAATDMKATLVWDRQVSPVATGGYSTQLRNLDLYLYSAAGAQPQIAASASGVDNVEQVTAVAGSVAGGDFVVKVKDIGPAFRQEPFALATSAAFHFVNGPSLAISCTNNNPLPNHTVTITCTAANQGDLPISGLTATLTWKNGTGGSLPNTWSFSEKGVTGDTQTVTFQGPAPQAPPLDNGGYTITLAGTNYGEPRSWSTEGDIFGTDCTNGFWLNPTGQAIGEDMKQVQFQMFVPSTCAWTTSTTQHADWVSINPPGGKGNATITVTVLATPAVIDPTIPNGTNGLAIQFTSGGILGGKFNLVFGKDGTGLSAQGLVRNPNQLPIAGATVTFTGAGAPAPVVTDAGGAWSQKGFSNTVSYTATASKPGYNFTVNNVPFTGGTTANVQMIGSSQYTASGQVISKYGKSIAGVTLTFAATNTTGTRSAPAPVTTDANGNWTQAGFESGTPYQVTPSRGTTSFSPSYRAFSDLTAPNMSLNFQDPTTFNASGIVQTKNGVPIPGVTVAFATDYGPRQNWVQTDATGRWSQTGFDPYVVNTAPLLLAGYTFSPATLTIGPAELLATGTSPYSASGTIVNSFGIALDGIVITITPDQGTAPNPFTTLKDGKFSFSELEKLTKYTLVPAKASYQFNPPSLVVTGPSTTLQFTAALVRPVSGTVVNPRGEPLSGAVVSFTRTSDKQPAPGNTNADAKGAWLQNGFESGTGIVYQATATLANYTFTPRSAVHAGDTGVTITGTPGKFTASGTVTLPAGASPTGVSLQFALALTTEHKGPVPANQNPSSTGAWSLAGFEDGTTYRVTPVRSGYTFSPAYLDFTVDKSTGLNFTGAKN